MTRCDAWRRCLQRLAQGSNQASPTSSDTNASKPRLQGTVLAITRWHSPGQPAAGTSVATTSADKAKGGGAMPEHVAMGVWVRWSSGYVNVYRCNHTSGVYEVVAVPATASTAVGADPDPAASEPPEAHGIDSSNATSTPTPDSDGATTSISPRLQQGGVMGSDASQAVADTDVAAGGGGQSTRGDNGGGSTAGGSDNTAAAEEAAGVAVLVAATDTANNEFAAAVGDALVTRSAPMVELDAALAAVGAAVEQACVRQPSGASRPPPCNVWSSPC